VEAFEGGRLLSLGGREHLDRDPPAHELVFAQVDAAHAAGTQALEHLVFADGEPPPLTQQELLGLEMRQQAVAHQHAGQLSDLLRKRPDGALFLQVGVQTFIVHDAALAHQVKEFLTSCWVGHPPTFRGSRKTPPALRPPRHQPLKPVTRERGDLSAQ